MGKTPVKTTAEDLLALATSGRRFELVAGELIELAPAGGEHGYVAAETLFRLRSFIERVGLGGAVFAAETGFRIARNPDTVRAPDVAYVTEGRLAEARVSGYPEIAPDLVVEVVSPSDSAVDVQAKVQGWLQAGTRLVWVLYPASRSAVSYRQGGEAQVHQAEDTLTGDPVLPGFACRVADLF